MLALVALFTGAFLVFSILSLSVAKRHAAVRAARRAGPDGARAAARWCWPSRCCSAWSAASLGLALGTALAALALRLLGGDLGGGYFAGVAPTLQLRRAGAALLYGALGVAAALVGGWLPARAAQAIAPAQTLKGLGPRPTGAALDRGSAWS